MITRRAPLKRNTKPIKRSPLKRKIRPVVSGLQFRDTPARKLKPKADQARKRKGPVARDRAKRRRAMLTVAAQDRENVRARQRGRCFAEGISPVCRGAMQDPHELIPVGAGGKRISPNRVGLCRVDHDEAQGRVGGNRLLFDWPGRDEGRPPNADEPGNVRAFWRP